MTIEIPSVLALWLFPNNSYLKPISAKEKQLANELPSWRSRQYQHSRGHARQALSELLHISPLDVPLEAKPGEAPVLEEGWGYVSFSHCNDALLIGWAPHKIGVDLERANRNFKAELLMNRYFCKEEKESLRDLKGEELRKAVLKRWLIKEASIKWQRGQLAKDLSQWSYSSQSELASHKLNGQKLCVHQITYSKWFMTIAYDQIKTSNSPIICVS